MHSVQRFITKDQIRYALYITGIIIIIIGLLGCVSFVIYLLNKAGYIVAFLTWIGNIGPLGYIIMLFCIVVVNFPFMVGYGSLMFACGFLFHFWKGLLTIVVGCQIGVALVGLLIRIKYIRSKSEEYINSKPYIKAMMDELIQHKIKFAFLIRVGPIPLGLQNLVLSLSGIPMWQYMLTSCIGLLIEQVPLVYIGSTLMQLSDALSGSNPLDWREGLVIVISGVAICLLIGFLFFITKRAFKKVKLRELELKKKTEEFENPAEVSIELDTLSSSDQESGVVEMKHVEVEIIIDDHHNEDNGEEMVYIPDDIHKSNSGALDATDPSNYADSLDSRNDNFGDGGSDDNVDIFQRDRIEDEREEIELQSQSTPIEWNSQSDNGYGDDNNEHTVNIDSLEGEDIPLVEAHGIPNDIAAPAGEDLVDEATSDNDRLLSHYSDSSPSLHGDIVVNEHYNDIDDNTINDSNGNNGGDDRGIVNEKNNIVVNFSFDDNFEDADPNFTFGDGNNNDYQSSEFVNFYANDNNSSSNTLEKEDDFEEEML